jgi:death-on-curing protein
MLIYLTADEVKTINQHFLGTQALRDESALAAAMARPLAAAYYQQADLVSQAAILIEGIAQAHAFVDANKRTATAAGLVFLRLNGYTIHYMPDPLNDELGQQVIQLVLHQITVDAFAQWLRARMVAIP